MLQTLKSQPIVIEDFIYSQQYYYQNYYKNFSKISTFGPLAYNDFFNDESNDSSRFKLIGGLEFINTDNKGYAHSFRLYTSYHFKNNFYFYFNPRLVSDVKLFHRYSGLPRDIRRIGFNSGETDLSGFGFSNDSFILQVGRGRQSWGAGNDIQLVISNNSVSYDHFLFGINLKNLRLRYFHGFLERFKDHNRYLVGKGIEYTNQKNFLISLSEIIIYSGNNRPLDISYLNPISSHLEIELNERQNINGTGSGNAVWQLSLEYFIKSNIKLSFNYLLDEYVLDESERELGKINLDATSAKFVYNVKNTKYDFYSYFFQLVNVGTHTFRHEAIRNEENNIYYGFNNFVHRGLPLGWEAGSDSRDLRFGIILGKHDNFNMKLSSGFLEIGSNSILFDPYKPYENTYKTKFPSGDSVNKNYFLLKLFWYYNQKCSIGFRFNYNDYNNDGNSLHFIHNYNFN
tara:strand:- start:14932 stop:16302 length:1371 start_codon:yes stop_codon:yes gene_type:complete